MTNPFASRNLSLNGPVTDIQPVTPSDSLDLPEVAVALYVETGGSLTVTTVSGAQRTLNVADWAILPVGVLRVHQTGTTAAGIGALVLA